MSRAGAQTLKKSFYFYTNKNGNEEFEDNIKEVKHAVWDETQKKD